MKTITISSFQKLESNCEQTFFVRECRCLRLTTFISIWYRGGVRHEQVRIIEKWFFNRWMCRFHYLDMSLPSWKQTLTLTEGS